VSASPGAAVGKVVFDSPRAVELAAQDEKVILVRRETNRTTCTHDRRPGILTSRGGKTSHAAVVAAAWARPVSAAPRNSTWTPRRDVHRPGGITVSEGDVISIDGTSGVVYLGEIPVVSSEIVRYFEGELQPDSDEADDLIRAVHRIMVHADASAASACMPTRTPARTASGRAGSAPPAWAWSVPSTCSSASAASWSRT